MPSNSNANEPVDEEMPLLPNHSSPTKTPVTLISRCRRHLRADVSRDWADVVLVLCYFITGLLDSASISYWGSFVSMQTGTPINHLELLDCFEYS